MQLPTALLVAAASPTHPIRCGSDHVQIPSETSGEAAFDIMLTTYTLFEREGGYKADRAFLLK